jgi:hypothetical protein
VGVGRIRTVKPELIQQPWFATLSDSAARTYYGLLGVVDDFGRCGAAPSYIAGQIFWGSQRSANKIGKQLAELEREGIIRRYTVKGGEYLEIVGWFDKGGPLYQQINKPQGERFPAPSSDQDGPGARPDTGPDLDPIRSRVEPEGETTRGEADREREAPAPAPAPAIPLCDGKPSPCPAGWMPAGTDQNSDAVDDAIENGVDLDAELTAFRDYEPSKPMNEVDRNAAWRRWIRRARAPSRDDERLSYAAVAELDGVLLFAELIGSPVIGTNRYVVKQQNGLFRSASDAEAQVAFKADRHRGKVGAR